MTTTLRAPAPNHPESRLVFRKRPSRSASHPVPRWVRWFTNLGRPVVAIVVLVMCAPGEHHLAVLAGWDGRLAWGMAAVLAAYAGIAASVASNRPPDAPGKASAVAGAVVSLGAAMAAQPVSHLFVTGWFSADPRPPVWLVIVVSCVPPLVFGHLLHLAATPLPATTETPATPAAEPEKQPVPAPETPEQPEDEQDDEAETDETRPETGGFLTTRQVADRYGVKDSTIRTWKDRGKITPALVDPRLGNLYDPETLPPAAAVG